MFLFEDACRQRCRGVVGHHAHGALNDDRSPIELRRYQMNCHAAHPHPVFDGLPLRIKSGEGRQE